MHSGTGEPRRRTRGSPRSSGSRGSCPSGARPRSGPPARRVDLRPGAVELHRAADPAGDMEDVGEDRPGRPGRPRERLSIGEGARSLVEDLEVGPAPSLAVEDETEALAVVEDALRPGADPRLVEEGERETLTVPAEPAAALPVDAAPEVGRPTVELVADAVVPAEPAGRVAPGQVRALLPVGSSPAGCRPSSSMASSGMGSG